MKVLIVHGRYRSAAPSGENHVVDQEAELLMSAGHDVALFQRHSDDIDQWSLPRKAALPALTLHNPEVGRDLARRLSADRPDVVHVHNTFPVISPAVLRACWAARVPVVMTVHNYRLLCASGDFFRDGRVCHACADGSLAPALRNGCYRGSRAATAVVVAGMAANRGAWRSQVSAYLFISASQRDLVARAAELPPERVFVKHNFVALAPATHQQDPVHRVTYVGRLDPAKGTPFLMEAWDRFRSRRPESRLRLAIAGGGPLGDRVASWATQHASVDVHGHLPRDQVSDLMAGSRAVVVPSAWEETFGLVAVEAMAAGVAPVAPAHGSFPEIVEAGATGELYRPGDVEDLVRVLARVDDHPESFAEYGRRGKLAHAERFSRERGLALLEDAYRFVIAEPAFALPGHAIAPEPNGSDRAMS